MTTDNRPLRIQMLERSGADLYMEILSPTWGGVPGRLIGTPFEGAIGYIVQVGDLHGIGGTVVPTREAAAELVISLMREAMQRQQSMVQAFNVPPDDARYFTEHIDLAVGKTEGRA